MPDWMLDIERIADNKRLHVRQERVTPSSMQRNGKGRTGI